jgi:hypothetical protein
VSLDSELTLKKYVSKVVSVCYYHLRRLVNWSLFDASLASR